MDTYCCFVSIPKCASKTILTMLEMGRNRNSHYKERTKQYILYENHQRLKVLEKNYNLNDKFVFTFVRNPYDRVKSWFYYHGDLEPYKSKTLNQWIKEGCKTHWVIQNKTNWEKEKLNPLLQYNFIEGTKKVDYIGKIENFEIDCKNIISKINKILKKQKISKQLKYKPVQQNSWRQFPKHEKKKKEEEITEENKELIYKMFQKDFEYFNYRR